jgi:quinol monooxygenase YgiN
MKGADMRKLVTMVLPLTLLSLGCSGASAPGSGGAQDAPRPDKAERSPPVVRVAELVIDPAHLEGYTAAVKEEMETSVRVEPGVLAIYCVAEKDNPARLRFFEMYADEAAYKAHIESAHFKKYVATTKAMIVSRKLIDAVPVQLSAKAK